MRSTHARGSPSKTVLPETTAHRGGTRAKGARPSRTALAPGMSCTCRSESMEAGDLLGRTPNEQAMGIAFPCRSKWACVCALTKHSAALAPTHRCGAPSDSSRQSRQCAPRGLEVTSRLQRQLELRAWRWRHWSSSPVVGRTMSQSPRERRRRWVRTDPEVSACQRVLGRVTGSNRKRVGAPIAASRLRPRGNGV